MKIKDYVKFKCRDDYEETLVNKWFIEYIIDNEPSYLSINECIVLTQLPMMYNHRYDRDILNDYDKAIKGYKNWNDFNRRSQIYFTSKYVEIDQENILLDLINRIFTDLISKGSNNCNYIELCSYLVPSFRLYHVKSFNKDKLFSMMKSFSSSEINRLIEILNAVKRWNIHFLFQVFEEDFSERVYKISNNYNTIEHIICTE